MTTKPACGDFIVAAIRKTRLKNKAMKKDTAGGRSVDWIFRMSQEYYSEAEFRKGLHKLLETGAAVMVARKDTVTNGHMHSYSTWVSFDRIPKNAALNEYSWWLDRKGQRVDQKHPEKHPNHFRYVGVMIFVVADGLPVYVKRVLKLHKPVSSVKIAAEAVMESLKG